MESVEQFGNEVTWTTIEKKTARRAFDKAFERHCAAIAAEARRMLEKMSTPSDIWRVEEYLYEHRKAADRIYDYRYSHLLVVFSRLMRDGWLTGADLAGLQQEKIAEIRRSVAQLLMRRISAMSPRRMALTEKTGWGKIPLRKRLQPRKPYQGGTTRCP
jgi:hypothetical protein